MRSREITDDGGEPVTPPQPFVQTVLGPIDPARLGSTLMHEHLIWDYSTAIGATPRVESIWPIERIVERVDEAQRYGVQCIVDVTPEQLGPHPLLYALIAQRTPVHLVCATGYYCSDVIPTLGGPRGVYPPDHARIAGQIVATATHGIGATGIKPGIIKVATSGRAISEVEEAVLRAAASAQQRTGLAITTHTQATRFAETQVDILEDAGADLARVVIGHIGWGSGAGDFALHQRLARRGVTLGLDLVGTPTRSDSEYIRMALDLIEAGHAHQLVFSHDNCGWANGFELYDSHLGPEYYSGDMTHVHRRILPLLMDEHIATHTIATILHETPSRLLTIDPCAYPGARDTLLWTPSNNDPLRLGDAARPSRSHS